ncbi:hypothetical protein [Streptomyces sp. NPDC058595]|uniref:hypothetical protein n=1 Tax=Streptomyces sp. NPDC058595 TaxID=3346550 RepID=UPI00366682BF
MITDPTGPIAPRDVVVFGCSGTGYVLTDALRAAGLSVGSWLLPAGATPVRAATRYFRDLDDGSTAARWYGAAVGISLWRCPRVAARVDPLAHATLERHAPAGGARLRWLNLSPSSSATPLVADWSEHLYLPPGTRSALEAAAQDADPAGTYARTVRALLRTLPGPVGTPFSAPHSPIGPAVFAR